MNRRFVKVAALVVTGGFMLQIAGCGTIIAQIVAQNLLVTLLTNAIDGILGTTA